MKSVMNALGVALEFANGRRLFEDLNFRLDPGITALVGPNGAGKTCLAKLLSGELVPSRGRIQWSQPLSLFPQREEPPPVSVAEYLAQRYGWSMLGERLLKGIDREASCATLSGGQWMRVRLAGFLEEGFVILDEPTNDLDRDGRRSVLQFLREHQGGVLLISHDRECLQLCDQVLELSSRGLARYGGGWRSYIESRDRERENAQAALELAKRERERAASARVEQRERQAKRCREGAKSAARGGMPKILIGARKRRAEVTTGKVEVSTTDKAREAVSAAFEAYQRMKVEPVMYADLAGREIPSQKLVAQGRGFNVKFERWLFPRDLSFCWRGGLRIALKGGNGQGKTTLLRAVLGEPFQTRGELRLGGLCTLYIDQRCARLDDQKSVLENVMACSQSDQSELRNGLAKLLFRGDAVHQKVGQLSGGERLRAALAQGLLSADKPELLVLDEPTNNLDLPNITFLENLVRGFRGALVVVSHDEEFLRNCEVTGELDLDQE